MEKFSIFDPVTRRFVTMKQLIRDVHIMKHVCHSSSYLECIVLHNHIHRLSHACAKMTGRKEFADPDVLVQEMCKLHPEWCDIPEKFDQ